MFSGSHVILEENSRDIQAETIHNSQAKLEGVDDYLDSVRKKKMQQSPVSNSNMTFLSGMGVFDWATSHLMDDVLNGIESF